ncbi:MAG: hypothetical protein KDF60_20035, partial [Calditrichaeota bacterium]|nr:hypothetical protein [Calditrichota bacterium]
YIAGEATIYRYCRKLKPGHYIKIDVGGMQVASWWQLEEKVKETNTLDEKEALRELDSLVHSSVSYSMISDVPLGIFLSGGVDSSLVASVAQQQLSVPVNTFSIAFEDGKYNEAKFARRVANHIGSSHHEFTVTENEAIEMVEELMNIYDEPYGDSSAIPTLLVSKLARKYVTVALSGDGGDELFMGYGFYYWARRLQNPAISLLRKPIAGILAMSGKNRLIRAGKMFEYPVPGKRMSHIFSQEQYYFSEKEIEKFLTKPGQSNIDNSAFFCDKRLSWAEQQSFFDIKNYLPEELLVKTDRASMYHSLEVRVPLLDHRIVEFAINLPEKFKLKGDVGKYLLKQVLYQYVPKEIFDRPKWGFAVPLSKWLKRDLKFLLDKYLDPVLLEEAHLVDTSQAIMLKNKFLQGSDYLYTRIWALVILHKWYRENHLN